MSWNNPSQDEAADEYYLSKSRYQNAANQRSAAMRAAENCCAEKAQALTAISSYMNDKINFEKRIEDIKMIIAVLEGNSGAGILGSIVGGSIPEVISKFNNAARQADSSYKGSMKCIDIMAASIQDVFKSKSVDEDSYLYDALQKFKNEAARLEQELRNLEAQMDNLTNLVNELTSKINMYNAEQADWRRVMVSSAFEMNHFKSYM